MKRIITCPECNEVKEHYGRGLCRRCHRRLYSNPAYRQKHREQIRLIDKRYYERHRETMMKQSKARRDKYRAEMIEAYGGQCVCCGESEPAFLTVDHIHNDGAEHRKRKRGAGSGFSLAIELKKQGWPKDRYQLLCMNCNMAKGNLGVCPHQQKN